MRWSSATRDGRELGRGLVAYAQADAERVSSARRAARSPRILGYRGRAEMIHRDDMVLSRS